MPLDRDTRAKKIAATLSRGGYDVVILSPVATGADETTQTMGDVTVVPVPVSTRHRDAANRRIVVRRQAAPRVITTEEPESYVTRLAERKQALRRRRAKAARLRADVSPTGQGVVNGAKWAVVRGQAALTKIELTTMRSRWRAQDRLNKAVKKSWREFDERRRESDLLATTHGVLPEIRDYADAFAPVLDRLKPDVIHAHHPFILHTAIRAARRRRADGHSCHVVYDARENFAGIPKGEQGSPRRHAVLVRQETETIKSMDRVLTVSEPIADELHDRYRLARRPSVVLNVPVRMERTKVSTVRDVCGLDADTPLLVYSGGISGARGLETLVEALGRLDDVHLVIVAVPHPHPSVPALLARAIEVGAGQRVHVTGPVPPHDIPTFLGGADVAVHPMPGGSPNHDQAMPNKLFEYLHAGLPLVVSDARLMADFVRSNQVGEVFTSGDAESLVAAVERVRKSPPAEDTIAAVAERYSWQGQERELLDVYDDLTGFTSCLRSPEGIDLEVRTHQTGGLT
ncbi:glycosyltransferase family 4 protein [Terrabacter koreensis]